MNVCMDEPARLRFYTLHGCCAEVKHWNTHLASARSRSCLASGLSSKKYRDHRGARERHWTFLHLLRSLYHFISTSIPLLIATLHVNLSVALRTFAEYRE